MKNNLFSTSMVVLPIISAVQPIWAQKVSNKPLNIVCIFTDDHAFQTISAYGHPISKLAPTPNIDRLAGNGMLFTQSFVENSISAPSRATLLTGLYSHQHGQTRLGCCLNPQKQWFTELLQKKGYVTSVFGKWHLNVEPKGFDHYDILFEGRDPEEFKRHVAVQAAIEIGFERFLEEKNYQAVVTHFGDLGSLQQLPGLAMQRLMEKGYGFGAEGDWKTAAMVRLMKIMTAGVKDAKGTSFMEDYTYNLVPGKEGILQSHMLEVCPTIADGKIGIKVCPLSMGAREDPARLVFTSKTGPAVATSLVDLGDRFRLIINDVDCKKVEKPMPKLPVGSAFWTPQPDLATGAEAWILAGGAHHTAFSYDLTAEQMGDWAAAMGIEAVYIDKDTTIRNFKNELRWNEVAFRK